ncbi:MAG: FtsX-like permease family protein [Desulfobacterales bacterium]|nr:FtsX-like permease family protein [Desulfobacterales bacterium]
MGRAPLLRICFTDSRSHFLRTLLMVFGIAMGVAGVTAIDIAKTSVSKSFDLSTAALTSRSTHQIKGSNLRIPQALFTRLRTGLGITASAPVITATVRVNEIEGALMTLMGVDPFSEGAFRDFRVRSSGVRADGGLREVMIQGSGVLLSRELAGKHALNKGDVLTLMLGKREVRTRIGAVMEGVSPALDGVLVTDIALAQEMLEMGNDISRIDLKLAGRKEAAAVKAILEPGQVLVETGRLNMTIRGLSRSFENSLTAFSVLVLFMGIFLIYNTVSFSIARRSRLNGILRALGATRQEIFRAVEIEILIYALAGSILGVGLGILLGKGAVHAVCSTVSDMYYTLTVSQTHIAPATLVKGVMTGLGAALASSFIPALNAANTPAVTLMQRSASESRLVRYLPGLTICGIMAAGGALVIFYRPESGLTLVFSGVFLVFTGGSFLAPALISVLTRIMDGCLPWMTGLMALRNLRRSLSRTSVLIASLMVVISVYIGIDTMTRSFRLSIVEWVGRHMGGDIHLSSPDELNPSLDKGLMAEIGSFPRVKDISAYNIHKVFSSKAGEVHIFSYLKDLSEKQWTWTVPAASTAPGRLDAAMNGLLDQGWIFVSEIFARQHGVFPETGAGITRVVMDTLKGPVSFRVAGIFRDFLMGGGRVVVSRRTMKTYWGHDDITAMQIFVHPENGEDKSGAISAVMARIKGLVPDDGMVRIRSGLTIKQRILAVFDKTFLITSALQVLTAVVALTGILNSVMALILERSGELGILRACGAVPAQIRALILWECGLSGFLAGLLALPLGWFLSWVLVHVVNFRAFGWTYEMQMSGVTLVQALAFSALAAVAAGIVPAFRAGRIKVADALRTE